MNIADVQRLLAEANYYRGAIDGDAGPLTMAAVAVIERNSSEAGISSWSKARRLVRAGQAVLRAQGFPVGDLDGWMGPQTAEALTQWRSERAGTSWTMDRTPADASGLSHPAQLNWPRQKEVREFFGPAGGAACTAGVVELPFPFVIAWDKSQSVSRFYCHEKVAEPLTWIFAEAHRSFGAERMQDMGLDLYGGCFANRPMRGGAATSMHAWGIAVDLDPEHNQLRWGADRARFAKPEYRDWWQIVMQAGAVPAGYAWGKDWMHFQFARL